MGTAKALTQREIARIAGVSRALPQELQRAGVLGQELTSEDVLVVLAAACIPKRWLTEDPTTGARMEGVAGLVRQFSRSGARGFLVVTPTQAYINRSALPHALEAGEPMLLLPLEHWSQALERGEKVVVTH